VNIRPAGVVQSGHQELREAEFLARRAPGDGSGDAMTKAFITLIWALAVAVPAAAQAPERAALAAVEQRIRTGEIQGVHSLIAMRGNEILAEWYFQGMDEARGRQPGIVRFGPDTLHDLRSVTKSIVALLVGVALEEGAIRSLDTPALDYFPEYANLQTPERRRITLRHLLTMGSGLHWDEETFPYTDARNSETAMDLAPDANRFVLSQPIEAAPGARFKYSGGDVAIMAAILARATRTSLEAYAEAKLFRPLGIARVEWHRGANGVPYAASGLRMRPRDMAKIGRLMLQRGRWEGRQVIPANWVEASIQPHTRVEPDPACGVQYGYFWWLQAGCQFTPAQPWVAAIGNGGQRIALVPDLDLVIVMTAGLYNRPGQRQMANATVLGIIGAVRNSAASPRPTN
jgi:CubicO group peptidase (beta-lactamase class C family)